MSRLTHNILANVAGQFWSLLISLAVIPLYIKFLGIEAYGLIGFYVMLQGVLQILDFGLSPTMNRELARYSAMPEKSSEARDVVRTLEIGYWLVGFALSLLVIAGSPFIATHWLKASVIPVNEAQRAVLIMGVLVALQWPISFYQSGLMGLQKQVLVNGVNITLSTVSGGGAVLILWLVSPTITAFFAWQVCVSFMQVVMITLLLWRNLPNSSRSPKFDLGVIRRTWRFAAGMSGLTVSGLILTQLDKVILSKMLSLEMFGYYTLATAIGRGLYVLITPVFNAIFPRMSALVAIGDISGLRDLYHRGCQLMAVLVISLAGIAALFSYDFLVLWVGNAEMARMTAPIASLLVIGTALNALMNVPFALQLAYGWTQIGLYINSFFILTLVPAIVFMTTHYGAVGGASVWVALNGSYLLIGIPLTHTRLLPGEAWRCFEDIVFPCIAALSVAGAGRWLLASPLSPMVMFVDLPMVLLTALLVAALVAPSIRIWLVSKLSMVTLGLHDRYKHYSGN